jgi:cation:H+ antiporter
VELQPETFQSDLTERDSQIGTKPMMLMNGFWILVSLGLLYAGAEGLVRGSASLALRLGLTPLVVGLTVVAMGTSMPEVLVSVDAALQNRGDLAVGNVIGSNIFNVGIILGFTALLAPMKVQFQLIKFDAPIMAAVSLLVPLVLWDGVVTRWEGVGLFAGLVAYVLFNVRLARRTANETVTAEYQEGVPAKSGSMALDLGFIILGLGLLAAGARLLTENSVAVARGFGVSEAVIGLTIVAAGTSVPELAASIVAALKKEPDIALGNVVGSNIFNILGILGIASIVRPLEAAQISRFDIWSMVAIGVALVPMLMTGLRLGRREGGVLVAAYCVYVAMLWPK